MPHPFYSYASSKCDGLGLNVSISRIDFIKIQINFKSENYC